MSAATPPTAPRAGADADADAQTVRIPLWSGMQPVAALWFDAERGSTETRALRMIAVWRSGARALRFAEGDLLRFPAAMLCVCESLPGEALCTVAPGVLASAPLAGDELATARGADLLLVRDARVLALRTGDARELDLSAWIDLGAYAVHDTFDCTPPPAPPAEVRALRGQSLREALGDKAPAPSPEMQRFLERAQARQARQTRRALDGAARPGLAERWLPRVFGLLAGVVGAATGRGRTAEGAAGRAGGGDIEPRRAPAMPSALRAALARLALASGASQLIGWRQAAYLRRLMSMFDEGDLLEALRHALPLGDGPGGSLGQGFGIPGRRQDLALRAQAGASTGVNFGESAEAHLRRLYRQAFERLDRQGRIDEAAFVLGELLNARQECLDYLERHGRTRQAAELALGWQMPGTTIVRLLLLAGDWNRAVLVARRDRAFASVVSALEAPYPSLALKLRLAWAEDLAERGDWLGAVDAVWPVPHARHLAAEWLRIAETADDGLSMRALVRRAELLPDTLDLHAGRIEACIAGVSSAEGEAPDPVRDAAERAALAAALLKVGQRTAAVAKIAAALLPAVAADRSANVNTLGKRDLDRLLELSGDPYLQADVPHWSAPQTETSPKLWERATPARYDAPAPGLVAIADAASLGEGRYLLALGEAGVAVCDRHGRIRQRYPVPATSLAVAEGGAVALAIARRESVSRIARLDLVRRVATDLGSMRLDAHAPRFDGVAWSVVADNRILVIDTARSLRDVLWHVGDLPGALIAARYGDAFELYLIRTPHGDECWHYDVGSRRLLCRNEVRVDDAMPLALREQGRIVQPERIERVDRDIRIHYATYGTHRQTAALPVSGAPGDPPDPAALYVRAVQHGLMFGIRDDDRFVFGLYRFGDGGRVAEVHWPADAAPTIHQAGDHLLLCDRRGRVLDLPLTQGAATAFSVL